MMNMDPRQMKKLMQGMKEIDAKEVIIRLADKELFIENPKVVKISMMGQETYQIIGKAQEREIAGEEPDDGDAEMVAAQAGVPIEDAREALKASGGDIADAIIRLKEK